MANAGGKIWNICHRQKNVDRDDLGTASATTERSVGREVDITAAAKQAALDVGGLQPLRVPPITRRLLDHRGV